MTETGRILEINGTGVVIAPEKGFACFGCMNQECRNSGSLRAENSLALPLEKGQIVEVGVSGSSLLAQALAALLPPALGFAAGYMQVRRFFPAAGEAAAAGAGVIALFAAAFAVYALRGKFAAQKGYAVTRIVG